MNDFFVNSIFILIGIGFIVLTMWAFKGERKRVEKDWNTLYDLEKRVNDITTLDDLIKFHLEFSEAAEKIHNEYIQARLAKIDGYCRGMYKILNAQKN